MRHLLLLGTILSWAFCVPAAYATLATSSSNGASWLTLQRNVDDGSWGASDAVKYVQTSEAVIALRALNQQGMAYFGGLAWLANHEPANIDFTARRVLALGAANQSVSADLQALQSAQNLSTPGPGNNGFGLSGTYQGSPLDTALTLQALTQQGVTTNVSQAVTYLTSSQLTGTDTGWALGQETTSDPITTAQVLIALIPLKAVSSAVPAAIINGLAALNAKVNTTSPVSQIALTIVANLRNNPSSTYAVTLLAALQSQQAADGSWGEDILATGLSLRAVAAGAGKDLSSQKAPISIPDNALRTAINNALGQSALNAITLGQIQQLTTLNASGLNISNLTGLQYATNLTYLDVRNNKIGSFAPIAGLSAPTILETGNPGYVAASSNSDVPTLPEWGEILLAGILLIIALKSSRANRGYRS